MARSTTRATASARWLPASTDRRRDERVQNADRNLQQILDVAGRASGGQGQHRSSSSPPTTASRPSAGARSIARAGRPTSESAQARLCGRARARSTRSKGTLPVRVPRHRPGDVDEDEPLRSRSARAKAVALYKRLAIDPALATWEHPVLGNGLIGIDVLQARRVRRARHRRRQRRVGSDLRARRQSSDRRADRRAAVDVRLRRRRVRRRHVRADRRARCR